MLRTMLAGHHWWVVDFLPYVFPSDFISSLLFSCVGSLYTHLGDKELFKIENDDGVKEFIILLHLFFIIIGANSNFPLLGWNCNWSIWDSANAENVTMIPRKWLVTDICISWVLNVLGVFLNIFGSRWNGWMKKYRTLEVQRINRRLFSATSFSPKQYSWLSL